ncbi:MAG: hypothetical protein WC878_05585 [Candidatus Paceibacterota bacterium]|jgi:hypothetical protein
MCDCVPVKFEPNDYLIEEILPEGERAFHLYKNGDDSFEHRMLTVTFKTCGEFRRFMSGLGLISIRQGFTNVRKLHDLKKWNSPDWHKK